MTRATRALVPAGALLLGLLGACCFGGVLPPSPTEPGLVEAARAYWDAHVAELRPPDSGLADAGPAGCTSGLTTLAADVAIAVITRGHAGGDAAGEVRIDLGRCFDYVIVLVVLSAGVWQGVQLIAYDDFGQEVARLGRDPGYFVEHDFRQTDVDFGSDELF